MSIANILFRFLSLLLHPEVLKCLSAFLLGSVAWPKVDKLPSKHELPVLLVMLTGFTGFLCLLNGPYPAWYETVREKANPNHPIGATQPEVDLEAQPLNLPPMPDMFDIEYNPWSLP
jgi:hypothetical protein